MSESSDIVKLSELLKIKNDSNSNSDDDEQPESGQDVAPVQSTSNNKSLPESEDEKQEAAHLESESIEEDGKICPQWELRDNSPATSSCETLVIEVLLPGEDLKNIDIDVSCEELFLTSSLYRLQIPLPQPINPRVGGARWDPDDYKLVITLIIDHEFD